ncbi:MAG: adenosylcobinamide-GDP ribazoletransferase [Candidatus Omnitrophota bacterium]
MTSLLLAIQFLTVFPLKISDVNERKLANSLIYFPLVGLLIGLILAGLGIVLFDLHFYEFTVAVILVVALTVITGGMHLDGLSDTFDALMSGKNKEKRLEIMRDSHAGVMGVISIVCALLLKAAFIFSLRPQDRPIVLILVCTLSRWSLVEVMFFFPYARSEGKAKIFMNNITFRIFLLATIITLIFAVLIWRVKGLFLFLVAGFTAWLFSKLISRKIGGITGDTLGATIELTEIITLFIICIYQRGAVYG